MRHRRSRRNGGEVNKNIRRARVIERLKVRLYRANLDGDKVLAGRILDQLNRIEVNLRGGK